MQDLELTSSPGSPAILRNLIDEKGVLARMGVEIGSLSTFYSMERPGLGALMNLDTETSTEDETVRLRACVRMVDACFEATEDFGLTPQGGFRRLQVKALEPSCLMDSVLRFVFPLDRVSRVSIGDRGFPWMRRNRYHQYLAEDSIVTLADGRRIHFRPTAFVVPEGMALFVYFRDEPDAWVFHVRMLAIRPTHFLVRGCSRWLNGPFSPFMQKVARSIPGFLKQTLYLRERLSQRIPFQTNGGIHLTPDQCLDFSVEWDIRG